MELDSRERLVVGDTDLSICSIRKAKGTPSLIRVKCKQESDKISRIKHKDTTGFEV